MTKLLLGVGAMKAGTTWLYRQLEQHPEILFAPEKELHFLAYLDGDRQALDLNHRLSRARRAWQRAREVGGLPSTSEITWYVDYVLLPKTWGWYQRRLVKPAGKGSYSADFSNLSATLSREGWQHVASRYKDLKALYMLRHPLARIWSHIKFHHQLGGSQADLAGAPELGALANTARLHSAYGSNLQTMLSVLERDQVLALNYDRISTAPLTMLREIEHFLELAENDYLELKLNRKINATRASAIPDWVRDTFGEACNRELDLLKDMNVDFPGDWYTL